MTCANYDCYDCEGGSGYEELQCRNCRCTWQLKSNGEKFYYECKKCNNTKNYEYDKLFVTIREA